MNLLQKIFGKHVDAAKRCLTCRTKIDLIFKTDYVICKKCVDVYKLCRKCGKDRHIYDDKNEEPTFCHDCLCEKYGKCGRHFNCTICPCINVHP